jgi:hypothetical protein
VSRWTCGYSGFLEKSSFGSKVLNLQAAWRRSRRVRSCAALEELSGDFFKIMGYLQWF